MVSTVGVAFDQIQGTTTHTRYDLVVHMVQRVVPAGGIGTPAGESIVKAATDGIAQCCKPRRYPAQDPVHDFDVSQRLR